MSERERPDSPVTTPAAEVNRRLSSSTDSSDKETENFVDAQDASSVRSLTKRNPSQQSELEAVFQKRKDKAAAKPTTERSSSSTSSQPTADESRDTPAAAATVAAVVDTNGQEERQEHDEVQQPQTQTQTQTQTPPPATGTNGIRKPSIASVASHRNSQTSNGDGEELDVVNLDDESAETKRNGVPDKKSPAERDPLSNNTNKSSKTLSLSSITQALPSLPWSPPANESPTKKSLPPIPPLTAAAAASAPAPAPLSRTFTSPFSWLSRSTTKESNPPSTSPPATSSTRRNTASSVATLASNPEMMLSRLEEEKPGRDANGTSSGPRSSSLRDRFKLVRMREEAGVTLFGDDEESSAAKSTGLGITSPVSGQANSAVADDSREGILSPQSLVAHPPASPNPTSPRPGLAPGTASGVDAGPSAISDVPVDWDLWQSVVYEGPAAVARTSPDDLNRAIATGIPNVIRGVVWQVLAQSKNEDLESVYRELAARGTDKEKDRHSGSSLGTSSNASNLSVGVSKDATASSASSIHSAVEGPVNGGFSPAGDLKEATEAALKAHQAAVAERKKREKEDKAALQKLEKVIRKDLGARTSYSKYAASQGLQEQLFGVCKAYALFDEAVGYAQGMSFLIMPLLFNMPEEEAFCLLVRLMNHYKLRDLYIHDMPGLHKHLYQFERVIEDLEPALYCHLHRKGISPHLYATQWFLTLFSYRFPLQLVLRIYDLILSEGLSAILRFGVVLMQKNAAALLAMSDMSTLTAFLRDKLFDVYIDAAPTSSGILENGFFGSSSSNMDKEVYRADQMIRDACEVKITPELLASYTAEWEEKNAAERAREAEITRRDAEIEELRLGNHASAVKIRKLEEQLQAHDSEQAELATQLVHLKVENQELTDECESLREQTKTLRQLLQDQPAELEKAWQEERDSLLRRNEQVHEENQKVEKEMADLEEQLVQTKMQYAEINSQHETLTRKWTDLKRQFA